ncbi:signal peptidase II [Candidatus Hydrogenosomobacter endosymbioticus]|uniref:Lipoprotein signal peptidase n=1 Tax=Candidatus Hydrogenosomobacter endosymbioticus TaxID=2558174 RepID=A0ABM7VA87_9PROT|nr:signal peptidase II [Candidatus Hydrogenosomobacter endosymbioticus]BDB96440.1 hypothetical protein HYD_5730 [Candidatus Hydrogenosomobacter endosymbioticus]
MGKRDVFISIVIVVSSILIDQITKRYAQCIKANTVIVDGLVNFVYSWNKGVSWGIFSSFGQPAIVLTALLIVLVLVFWLYRAPLVRKVGISFMIGGAIGNLIDRIIYGAVFDFLDFYHGEWHFPAFNVADILISVGVIISVTESLYDCKNKRV